VDKTGLTLIALWIHVPFVTAWIGLAIVDLVAATVPGLDDAQRGRLISWSRPFIVVGIVVIVLTGVWQTMFNPFREALSFGALEQLRETTVYGMVLFWKHGFVLATFTMTALIRFVLAPRLIAAAEDGSSADQVRRSVQSLAVLNLVACFGALLLATRMVWELH